MLVQINDELYFFFREQEGLPPTDYVLIFN